MAGFVLKIKSKNGQQIIKELLPQSKISDLKNCLASLASINVAYLYILYGFPPKPLDISNEEVTLESCGIASGETLIVEEKTSQVKNNQPPVPKEQPTQPSTAVSRQHITTDSKMNCPGILIKQVVPADNSCLFTSIGYVLNGKVDTSIGSYMREIIAEVVKNDPISYSEAILGKPNPEYCKWILKPDSWGGAIELAVLSQFYGIEMDVVDTLNAIINRFGEDQKYPHRVFLLFDGIHYDPLYLEPFEGGDIQTIFPIEDEHILQEAEQLAREAKSSRQFTDVNKFTLKCLVCGCFLTGQVQARYHAENTGHLNFGEV